MQRKPSHGTAKSTIFAVNKYKWDTKNDTGEPMKNTSHVLRYAKGTFWAEAMLNN